MSGRRRAWVAGAAGAVLGAAAYVSFGALAVANGSPSAPRVGVLPAAWVAALAVPAGAAALWAADRFTGLRGNRDWYLPLFLLLAVLLPWVPGPVPSAFLAWSGPLAVWTWLLAGGATILAAVRGFVRAPGPQFLTEPRRALVAAVLLGVLVYTGAAWKLAPLFPGGDEPHYLVITQSLLQDGDLKIENNHRQRDYAAYFHNTLKPDYLRRGTDGQIYSIHAPGLPSLIAPAFAVGGYPAVVVFLSIIGALAGALAWRTAYLVTDAVGAAWFGWAGVVLSAPVFFHAFAVYPEVTGAALVMTGVLALVALDAPSSGEGGEPERAGAARWVLHGSALAMLPWLHTRYAVAACVLGLLIVARLVRRPRPVRSVAAFLTAPAVSAAAWFAYFKVVYGTFSPSAPYGHYTQTKLAHIPVALPALLFDQQFGLLPNAPVYLVGLLGLASLWQSRRRLAAEIGLVVVSYALVVAAYRMWWAGWSPPARFLVPVLVPLAIPAAAAWARQQASSRAASAVALAISLLLTTTLTFAAGGWLVFNDRDGFSRWLEWISPLADLPLGMPSFLRGSLSAALSSTGLWLLALGAAWVVLRLLVRLPAWSAPGRRSLVALGTFGGAVVVALTALWAIAGARPVTASTAQVALLSRLADGSAHLGVVYRPPRFGAAAAVLPEIRLSAYGRPPGRPTDPVYTLPGVPAGTYRLDPPGAAAITGRLKVRVGRGVLPIATWDLDPGTRTVVRDFRLPCPANAIVIDADDAARGASDRLALEPIAIETPGHCPDARARGGARYGGTTALFFDDAVFADDAGFWVAGGQETTVVLAPDDPVASVGLVVRNGPVANRVIAKTGKWQADLSLSPHEQRTVEVPVDRRARAATLHLRAERGFRPVEVDPSSSDARNLGCRVEIARSERRP